MIILGPFFQQVGRTSYIFDSVPRPRAWAQEGLLQLAFMTQVKGVAELFRVRGENFRASLRRVFSSGLKGIQGGGGGTFLNHTYINVIQFNNVIQTPSPTR